MYVSTGPRLVSIHNMDFFHRIAFYCRNINSFHISQDNQHVLTAPHLMEIWSLFPMLTNWSFLGDNTPATLLNSLITHHHHNPILTSLQITQGMLDDHSQILLHDFLCQAPHLLHLNLATFVPIDRLDLEGNLLSNGCYRHRGDPETYMPGPHYIPHKKRTKRIWACRGLRSLVLNCSPYYNENDGKDVCRLVYGYLSKVCPDLEEIVFRRKFLNLRLESGMILLSRLKKLRRLIWVTGDHFGNKLKDRDMEWITRDMVPKMHRRQLMMIPSVLKAENHFLDQLVPFKSNKDHIIDGVNMKNIGRLYDIVDVIWDRAANKWTCWPQLEQWDIVTERQWGTSVNTKFFGDSMQRPISPVPMATKVIAIPELHAEIASHLRIYHFASCALVSQQWHDFWNPHVWSSIINRHPHDHGCARYGHLVRHFQAVLYGEGIRAIDITPISLDVVRQHFRDLKTVNLLSYSISLEGFGRRIMDIRDLSSPTGCRIDTEPISGVLPPRAVLNGFLSNTIQSLTLTLPYDIWRSVHHWIVLAGRQGQLQGLVKLKLMGANVLSISQSPKVSASDVQACPLLFPDLREYSTSLSVGDLEEDVGDMYSGGGEGGRQSRLKTLSLSSLSSSAVLPFILRPLHALDTLMIGGTTMQPILAQIPRLCPHLIHFEYISQFDRLGASFWIDFLAAYPRLTNLRLNKTDLADAVVLSLPRSCPSLQRLILPRQVSQITWQSVSALVENLAQLRVLSVEALTIPGEFFGTRKTEEEGA
ncbi:hypothetical protein BG006_006295 [Podila minutissima]|uniref:F-box domain-containing protein n=1 Tax=Podila minutissima TaxID=64525 RepID=A0A9P5VLJ4_9FUNG|nr:hypothetical protein BG006_006295 [Podila minutissima]